MTELNYSLNSSQTCGGAPLWSMFLFSTAFGSVIWVSVQHLLEVQQLKRYEYISAKSVWINERWREGGENQRNDGITE